MNKHLLSAVFAVILTASVQAQNELDELLKRQDVPAPANAATPRVDASPIQTPNASKADNSWKQYVNARFGFSLSYPGELVPSPAPANGSGCEYHTADKKFSLAASAQYLKVANPNDSLDARWQAELRVRGSTVTYKRKTESWYVISGANKDGTEYYHKFFVQGGNWSDFTTTYPHADGQRYDGWVAQIGKQFVPFVDGPFDRMKDR